jgi:hypothetical protein
VLFQDGDEVLEPRALALDGPVILDVKEYIDADAA